MPEIRSNWVEIGAHLLDIRSNFLDIGSTCTNLFEIVEKCVSCVDLITFGGCEVFENRRKVAPARLHERAARKKLAFVVPGRDLVAILVALACSRELLGALLDGTGRL